MSILVSKKDSLGIEYEKVTGKVLKESIYHGNTCYFIRHEGVIKSVNIQRVDCFNFDSDFVYYTKKLFNKIFKIQ